MKSINKIIILAYVLLYLVLPTFAQVSEITFSPQEKEFIPQIKWDDNKLFLTHPTGVYYQDYSCGELPEDWGKWYNRWEMFGFAGYEINDFAINGDKMIGVTSNPYPDGHMFVRSLDGGKTFENFTPKEIAEFVAEGTYYNVKPKFLIQNPIDKNELLLGCICIFRSKDFGETWERCNDFSPAFETAKYHPTDPNIIIVGHHSWYEYFPNGSFSISRDGGKTFDYILYEGDEIVQAKTIAFHYSNPDIIIVGSYPCVISTDKGLTWNIIKDAERFNFDFDTRGSDRLYACGRQNISYSDDFGKTWYELCEIPLYSDDEIIDFVQHEGVIYTYSKKNKVHQIDLSLLETSIDALSAENVGVTLSVAGDMLKVNAETPVTNIEVYNISGIKLLSQAMTDGDVDIANLLQGTYVARLQTVDGRSLSVKFNK